MSVPDRGAARNETTRRCIWVTEEDLDGAPIYLIDRWHDSPADVVEAVLTAVKAEVARSLTSSKRMPFATWVTTAALQALGWEATA